MPMKKIRLPFCVLLCLLWQILIPLYAESSRRLLIVDQKPDGHPPLTHEFAPSAKVLAELLKAYPEITATIPMPMIHGPTAQECSSNATP